MHGQSLQVSELPSLEQTGFAGGRDNLKTFCRRIFASREPRFLRNERNELVVFRHEDLRQFGPSTDIGAVPPAAMYPAFFDAAYTPRPITGAAVAEVVSNQVFTANDPVHGPVRRILATWLAPRPVAELEQLARQIAREVVAAIPERESFDFVSRVAERFTSLFWSRVLRLSETEAVTMMSCAKTMTLLFHCNRTHEENVALDGAFTAYRDAIEAACRRNLSLDEPLARLLAGQLAEIDVQDDVYKSGIVPRSLGAFLAGYLIDAFHTSALGSANAVCALLERPDVMAQVRASPALLPAAIIEALRLDPPVILLKRYALNDSTIAGVGIRKGIQIAMMWAAGNLDPQAFREPERFEIARQHQRLTTFGTGAHICPGRHAALMLSRILLEAILQGGKLGLAGLPQWHEQHLMCQLKSLPVTFSRSP